MTRRHDETPDRSDEWSNAEPDPLAVLMLDEARREADAAIDAVVVLINAALEGCTEPQRTYWRLNTGILEDGTQRDALTFQQIADLFDITTQTVRGAYYRAQVRVLSHVMAQRLPPHHREAAFAMLGTLDTRAPAEEAQLALAVNAPTLEAGRESTIAADHRRIDANTYAAARADVPMFGSWERTIPRSAAHRQGRDLERFHQAQLARIGRSSDT